MKFTLVGPAALVSGQPALLKVYVRNITAEPILLRLGDRAVPDVHLTTSGGVTVWNRYANRMHLDALSILELKAGQTLMWTYVWNGRSNDDRPVQPGVYTFRALFSTDQTRNLTWWSSPVSVTIR